MNTINITPISKAIDDLGGPSSAARVLSGLAGKKISPQRVSYWLTIGYTVPEYAPYVEQATAEKGARITMQQLCPEMNWGLVSALLASQSANDQEAAE